MQATVRVCQPNQNLIVLFLLSLFVGLEGKSWGQTTIVNYDFNSGATYAALSPILAPGVTSTASSTEAFVTFGGTATGTSAFTQNAVFGNALAMQNSSGSNAKYFQFQLGGSSLSTYSAYKIYVQSQRSTAGAQILTLAYSTDGTNFTNFGTTGSPNDGSFKEITYNVSAITAINNASSLYFRLYASGASGIGTLRIDNFQVQAVQATNSPSLTPTPATIAFVNTLAGATTAGTSVLLSGSNLALTSGAANITVTAPSTDFQVSSDNSTFSNSITLPNTSASFSGTFYVRFSPQTTGGKSGNVSISGGGASSTVAVTGTGANASITIGTLSTTSPCAGTAVTVPFTYSPTTGYGSAAFTAQLSSSTGSFTTPTDIGTVASNGSGSQSINATIPAGTASGTAYRIRVVSVNPAATSGISSAVTVSNIPAQPSAINGAAAVCNGTSQTYSVTSVTGVTYTWTFPSGWTIGMGQGSASVTVTPSATAGTITVTPSNTCGNGNAQTLAVTTSSALAGPPAASAATAVYTTGFTANWTAVANADSYSLDVYTKATVSTTISEGFDNGTAAPAGYIFTAIGGTYTTTGNYGISSPSLQFDATADRVQTATLTSPATQLSFWVKGQSTNAASAFLVEGYNGTSWVTIQNITNSIPTTGTVYTYNATTSIPLPSGLTQFRFTYTRSAGNLAFDDVSITTSGIGNVYVSGYQNLNVGNTTFYNVAGLTPGATYYYVVRAVNGCGSTANSNEVTVITPATCTSTATITAFLPQSGPANTLVTIRGTGFAAATNVLFGSTPALSIVKQGDTTLIAEVPANAPSDAISVVVGNCSAVSSSAFTLLSTSGTCGTGGSATDLMISEVYDAEAGSLSYVEVFNGTNASISLANYTVRVNTGAVSDFPLTGTLTSGSTYIVSMGSSPTSCPVTVNQNNSTGGFNGNDRIFLLKSGTVIDYIPNPNYNNGTGSDAPGFSQIRNATATGPSTTYNASEWTIYDNETCSNLGAGPFTPGASAITISSQPADVNCASTLTFSVTTGGSGTGTNTVVWKYNDPSSQMGWTNASTLNGNNGLTVTAATVGNISTLTITGTTGFLLNFQFYAEVTRQSCVVNSNAAQYSYETRPFYRTKTPLASGAIWGDAANWEMSTDMVTYIDACSFPTSVNSDMAEVVNGAKITMNNSYTLKQLIIDAGGELNNSTTSSKLTILNGNTAGADFMVNGTYTDNASTSNSLTLDVSTWQLGAAGTLIKTNTSSAAVYRDRYQGGMATIPATASWILRKAASTDVEFTLLNTFYPNLTIDNATGAVYIFQSTAASSGKATVKGNLTIGGTAPNAGPVTFVNNNSTTNGPMLINGNLLVRTGATLTNTASTPGTGFELKGNLTADGTLTANGGGTTGVFNFTGAAQQTVSGAGVLNLNNVTIGNTASGTNMGVLMNRNFTINGTATLTQGLLIINGNNLVLAGAVTRTNGSLQGAATEALATSNLRLTGAAAKTLYFRTGYYYMHDVLVDGTATNVNLTDSLYIAGGSAHGTLRVDGILNTNNWLSLRSSETGDGVAGQSGSTANGTITGNVTVERFIRKKRAWRFLSVPVTSTQYINDAWQEGSLPNSTTGGPLTPDNNKKPGYGTEITYDNSNNNGFDLSIYKNSSLKVYRPSDDSWQPVTSTYQPINTFAAYCLFVRGDRSIQLAQGTNAIPNNTILRTSGSLRTGTFTQNYTTDANTRVLISNPYASPIDITKVLQGNTSTFTQGKFWVWDPLANGEYNVGGYIVYNGGIQVPAGSNYTGDKYAQSGQAFMLEVAATATSATNVSFDETMKATTQVPNVFGREAVTGKTASGPPAIFANLLGRNDDNTLFIADGVATGFGNRYSEKVTTEDAKKMWNFDENLSLYRDTNNLSIEFRPVPKKTDTLFFRLYLRQQPYTLQIFSQNLPGNLPAKGWLVDNYLNTQTELSLYDTTLYPFTPNTDANSYRNRFMLVFNRVPKDSVLTSLTVKMATEAAGTTAVAGTVSVYPNPVQGGRVTMQLSNLAAGPYLVKVFGSSGGTLYQKKVVVSHSGNLQTEELLLSKGLAQGSYQLTLSDKKGNLVYTDKIMIVK